MRFLQPGLTRSDVERSETPVAAAPVPPVAAPVPPVTAPAADPELRPEPAPAERADPPSRPSEGLRILLERIDDLSSRLSACEDTIGRMARNEQALVERHAAERRDLEERLRRQIERQAADLSAVSEQRQQAFAVKQAKLLELLASELNKVRSMVESGARSRAAEQPAARADASPPRRRVTETGPELDFFGMDGDASGQRRQGAAGRSERGGEDVEFWDWLESLPPEPGPRTGDDIDLIDLDENDLR